MNFGLLASILMFFHFIVIAHHANGKALNLLFGNTYYEKYNQCK